MARCQVQVNLQKSTEDILDTAIDTTGYNHASSLVLLTVLLRKKKRIWQSADEICEEEDLP